jgi:hypothetical protein
MANPGLNDAKRADLVGRLLAAWRAVRDAKKGADREAEADAHRAVDEVKHALGERCPVWWDDSWPDLNRHMAKNMLFGVGSDARSASGRRARAKSWSKMSASGFNIA